MSEPRSAGEGAPPPGPPPDEGGSSVAAVRGVELRAAFLLGLIGALVLGFLAYLLYARGTFEPTQTLILTAEDSEGVAVGSDLTFAGFPIGRVRRIELAEDGQARIEIRVPRKDAHWLRATSVFTLERGLVGAARLRAFTGDKAAPPLPDGALRPVLRGDASAEIPQLLAHARNLTGNLERITAEGSDLDQSLRNLRVATEKLAGRYGALGALGGDENAKRVLDALARASRLLDSVAGVAAQISGTLARLDARVLGSGGLADDAQGAIRQLNTALAEARGSLKKVDAVLAQAEKVGANAAAATEDLVALRAEVEASLRRISALVEEIDRKWPFARDREIRLP
jgi:phospholipid/cholesterol/gamma-HCH transport system substrate-binding protein